MNDGALAAAQWGDLEGAQDGSRLTQKFYPRPCDMEAPISVSRAETVESLRSNPLLRRWPWQ